jgi:hypothetical protein
MNRDGASTKDHPRSVEPMTAQREKGTEQESELIGRKQQEQDWEKREKATGTRVGKKRQEGKNKIFPPQYCSEAGDLIQR